MEEQSVVSPNPESLAKDNQHYSPDAKKESSCDTCEDFDAFLNFSHTKKKKKVKFSVSFAYSVDLKNPEDATDYGHAEPEADEVCEDNEAVRVDPRTKAVGEMDSDLNFGGFKKKKKKSTKKMLQPESMDAETQPIEKEVAVSDQSWNNSDQAYTYDFLVTRFYQIALKDRPKVDEEQTVKLVLKPPQVFRVGSKKTSFANFLEICKALHRSPQHLMAFLLVEMGTSGSLDGNNQLIIKGRFQQSQLENIIRRYIKEYVKCATCSSVNTVIQKHIRLTFLVCESCESKRSVLSIKSGYQAVTGKRAAIRAKAVA